jgi:hypothetical protein
MNMQKRLAPDGRLTPNAKQRFCELEPSDREMPLDPNAYGHGRTMTDKSIRTTPLFAGFVDTCRQL